MEKTSNSLPIDTQTSDGHTSNATSKILNSQNDINKFQLPVLTEHSNISNIIQTNSSLTYLNEQDDTIPSKESIFNGNSTSDLHRHSSTKSSSIDSNAITTPIQNNKDKKLSVDNTVHDGFYTPIMLSPNNNIVQHPINTIISPSRSIVNVI